MKKVLVIAPYTYLPYFSGGQKLIAQFLDHLGRETDLTVISTVQNDVSLARSYTLISMLKKGFSRYINLSLVKKITAEIKKNNYDAVIWEHPYYGWLASAIKRRTGIKTIIHAHNIEYQRFHSTDRWWWPLLKSYEKWCFKKADLIFFVVPEDKNFAIANWGIKNENCIDTPFGVEIKSFPEDKSQCKKEIAVKHRIGPDEKIFLFNGLLDYKPNLDALKTILEEINPLLLLQTGFQYKILICGKRLPEAMNNLKDYLDKNVIYAGFVDDIESYFKATDIFLNPVQSGGGIKTKIVEAIAFGTTVVSTQSGAVGIEKNICGEKLVVVPDNDWPAFVNAVIDNTIINSITPPQYYEHYYWGNIVNKVAAILS
ncbi:MAG: glycosyltransferase family 4 protein [Bacteroidia bacterium]|nr:glycosyltransferase family 4 protein [Bacteroidia bacterium]